MAQLNRTLLIVDDDRIFCHSVRDYFATEAVEVLVAHSAEKGLAFCQSRHVDVVLLDENLPDGEGHRLCPDILKANEETKIIFITAFPSFDHAVQALKAGAHDYLSKPFELEELQLVIGQSFRTMELEKVRHVETYRTAKEREKHILIGGFGGDESIGELIRLAAKTASPLLITGETGTGKGVVARAIHFNGPRRDAPFIPINCAAIPENLIEAELFGNERGAFTGAMSVRKGIFELADGGTLFLDEIGAMPLHLQSKLLGVLDDRRVKRLGGNTFIPVDVRIAAATNADLPEMIRARTFREDLYYRISVLCIHLPPLRQRPDDIPELCRHLLAQLGEGRTDTLPETEMEALRRYPWPGNIRELRNILERSLLLHRHALRPSELIRQRDNDRAVFTGPLPDSVSPGGGPPEIRTLDEMNREYIAKVLELYAGNWTRSAKALGISISTLKRKVHEFRLP
jgi:DNA-binding NtrC family response regulator